MKMALLVFAIVTSISASPSRSGIRHDPILKERMFGLTAHEGNHGEDVKEYYFYLDNTPTHSYMKYLYKYPHAAYPYERLLEENRRRGKNDMEYELVDTGIFDQSRYFDVVVEYAKVAPEDVLIRISITNRGPEAAPDPHSAHTVVSQHLVVGTRRSAPISFQFSYSHFQGSSTPFHSRQTLATRRLHPLLFRRRRAYLHRK